MSDAEGTRSADDMPLPGGDFRLFTQKLAYQALISMGILDNPVTGTREKRLDQARTVIDDLLMLRDKTRGNLEEEEDEHLGRVISDVERHFVAISKDESTAS